MREILFRGKSACGAWVRGNLINRKIWHSEFQVIRTDDSGFDNYTEYEVITDTVGQHTGLRDSKRTAEYPEGQMIFEGDIVMLTTPMGEKYKSVVRFKEAKFEFFGLSNPSYFASRYAEVIGNIHDHPELLKGGEK